LIVLAGAQAQAMSPVFVETDTGCTFANECSTLVYVNTTVKINDRYTFSPETRFDLNYPHNGSKFGVAHKYIRFVITDKSLAKLGSWKLGMAYRYTAPTTEGAQNAGTLGSLLFRPFLTNEWNVGLGKISLALRENASIGLLKRPHVRTAAADGTFAGNTAFSQVFEILPTWSLNDNWSFSANWTVVNAYSLAGTAAPSKWDNNLYHAYEVDYSHPKYTLDTTLGVGINENTAPFGSAFKLFGKDTTQWYVVVARSF